MEPTRLFDFIYHQLENYPQDRAFGGRRDGQWHFYSTEEVIDLANQVSCGLLQAGIQKGDRIAVVVMENRPEWVILDLGIQQIGAVNVPIYPSVSKAEFAYILTDSGSKLCFVGKGDLYEKITEVQSQVPTLQAVYTFDQEEGRPFWEDIFSTEGIAALEEHRQNVAPEDLATLIYTSGTTGQPKGVMLSHRNISSNVMTVADITPIQTGDQVLSFLPLCHIFERAASYFYTYLGANVHFVGVDNLGGDEGDLRTVRPHFFTTVPRLLEKVYEKIYNKGLHLKGLKKALFFWALRLTEDFEFDKEPTGLKSVQWAIADSLIFSKWREALGGRVRGIVVGGAACPVRIAQVFPAAGIALREAYGLTETSPGLCFGRFEPNGAKLGTVGLALEGIELRIDDSEGAYLPGEGEILAKGPNIMMGYYNKPEATAAVMREIDGDTWFCTGDIGKLIEGKDGRQFLKITDRKKELLKTSGGKYVAPAPIENKLKENFLIEQAMVVGEKQKFVSALILPAEETLKEWCEHHELEWTGEEEMLKHPEVIRKYERIVEEVNQGFSRVEQIKKFTLVPGSWEPTRSDGTAAELTPTMKLKRRVIMDKYGKQIEAMYTE